MLGELNNEQIDYVLNHQALGRIGCYAHGQQYVVPVTYAYDGQYIYAHSREGMKIRMMRENPKVCFQVDAMENMANWRSVIVWGTYEELKDEEAQKKAMELMDTKLMPLITSETATPHRQTMIPHFVEKERKPILYRIKVEQKTGRFEKNQDHF